MSHTECRRPAVVVFDRLITKTCGDIHCQTLTKLSYRVQKFEVCI